jgi:SAM-dependent methyltransferase
MSTDPKDQNYLLAGGSAELERLRLQARVWEPESERMLDTIGVRPGWNCIDLGCGAMGILGPLSRSVGQYGRVVGVDQDDKQLAAAKEYVTQNRFDNVRIERKDAYATSEPAGFYDLVHVRFVFAPAGRDELLLSEMLRLTKPGGILAIQEPDASCWNCYPDSQHWNKLKVAILDAFRLGGGDFNVGRRTFSMLGGAGLTNLHIRPTVITLVGEHPYKRLPIQFAASLRQRILDHHLLSEAELTEAIEGVELVAADRQSGVTTFIVNQVWGSKPV